MQFPGSIAVAEFKCPFCDRTYRHETNWRSHIRQQHQGWTSRNESIRVSQITGGKTFLNLYTAGQKIYKNPGKKNS